MNVNPQPRKTHRVRKTLLVIGSVFATIIVVSVIVAAVNGTPSSTSTSSPAVSFTPITETPAPAAPVSAPSTPAAPLLTVPQQQAIASALSYLSGGQGFSKAGLFHQLHSPYGEGFSARLARFAVKFFDHGNIWRRQAVMSARSYMQSEPGWSRSALVAQLDSPYGEQFTVSQAEYAAHKVGL